MSHSIDTLKANQWAYIGLESTYASKAADPFAIKLLGGPPEITPVIEPDDQDVQSPYVGQPDRGHRRVAVEISFDFAVPAHVFDTSVDSQLLPIHSLYLSAGFDYNDDTGVAGSEARTTTYSRRTADQHSLSFWGYKLAENLDGSGNRLASEIIATGCRGGWQLEFASDQIVMGSATLQGLTTPDNNGNPYWRPVDTSSNLDQSIPDLSQLNAGRVDQPGREGTLVSFPYNVEYIRDLTVDPAVSPGRRAANAGQINAGTVDEIAAQRDGAPQLSFTVPQTEQTLSSGGLREALENTGRGTAAFEVEYTEPSEDSATQDSIMRVRAPNLRVIEATESDDGEIKTWEVTAAAYSDTGDDELEIEHEGTEA